VNLLYFSVLHPDGQAEEENGVREIEVPAYVDAVAAASDRVLASTRDLDDDAVALPSLLPGWNRAMVLTHLARNADGAAGVLDGARRGEAIPPYPHGPAGRAADIEAGRGRSASELCHDLKGSVARLAESYAAMSEADWEFESQWAAGPFTVWQLLISRWQEVEVHHVDLDLTYGPADWPASFVRVEMPRAIDGLPGRLAPGVALRLIEADGTGDWRVGAGAREPTVVCGPGCQLLAWLLGRPSSIADAPGIGPWH
jgi:maleylpyruvate isomerase